MKRLLLVVLSLMMVIILVAAPVKLTILHMNDTHGHMWTYGDKNGTGGFERIQAKISMVKSKAAEENGHVLVLHAGDVNTGIPESDQLNAIPDFLGLSVMGVDAMCPGNHEFDKEADVLALQQMVASFPIISSNYVDEKGNTIFKPYIIKDFGDLKVGIIGATTEQTLILEPIHLGTNTFKNVSESVAKYLPEVRKQADVVVVLGHLGYNEKPVFPIKYTTSDMLAQEVSGIDAIIDGHSHTVIDKKTVINGTLIGQAGEWGKYIGKMDLWVENGKVVNSEYSLIPIDAQKPSDPLIARLAKSYQEKGAEKLNVVIGKTDIVLDGERSSVRAKDTNLAHLITDSFIWKTGADFALTNGGGIRASIPVGNITYKSVLTVLPFGNTVSIVEMTGKDVIDLVTYAASIPDGQGARPQTALLTFDIVNGKPENILINKKPVDIGKTYKVATNDYVAAGGDGYTIFKGKPSYNTGFVMADVVKDYISLLGTIKYYDDVPRIVKK